MDTYVLILGASLIVIASYFFNFLSKKTNIPSVLMLMVLGYLISVGLESFVGYRLSSTDLVKPLSVLGTIGVILIVLEAALDLKLEKKKGPLLWRALVLSFLLLVGTALLIAGSFVLFLSMTFLQAMLYAIPLAVMSSAIIIPSVQGLIEAKKEFLIFESAFSDILGIIVFYALADFALTTASPEAESISAGSFFLQQCGSLLLTLVIALIASYVLIMLFQSLKGHNKLFLLIALLVGLYALGKLNHLSPLLLILIFGLMINNTHVFFPGKYSRLIEEEKLDESLGEFKTFTLEMAFVVRTFFFVVFGMSIQLSGLLNWTVWGISILALAAIYGLRYLGLRAVFKKNIFPELWVAPRGLITVLLFYAIPLSIHSEKFEPGILLLTILVSSLVMTFGLVKEGQKPKIEIIMDEEGKDKPSEKIPLQKPENEAVEKNNLGNDAP